MIATGQDVCFFGCEEPVKRSEPFSLSRVNAALAEFAHPDIYRDLEELVNAAYEFSNPYGHVFQTLLQRPDFQYGCYYRHRYFCTRFYSWAIPNQEALECIAEFGPILEVGAGNGYWAYLLRNMGVDVVAVDRHPPHPQSKNSYGHKTRYTYVRRGSSRAPLKYPERTLMLCWPPYDTSLAYDALRSYSGEYLIYIGEGTGGCNGDSRFWNELYDNWKHVRFQSIPQWPGIHDGLDIYRRR